ncbi:hypothetical protein TIFTF001_034097 [Ficus carica]|uniref:Uncharacterized protein n=1 Tax=Ficus carica TaxID=3494 RepID=A0AA88J8F2_FICCA|nr:hypothetical protein TIFTF001_034097 [Ficus carica]
MVKSQEFTCGSVDLSLDNILKPYKVILQQQDFKQQVQVFLGITSYEFTKGCTMSNGQNQCNHFGVYHSHKTNRITLFVNFSELPSFLISAGRVSCYMIFLSMCFSRTRGRVLFKEGPKRAAIRERNQGGNKSFGGWKLQQLWGGFAAAWWPNLGLGKQQELDFNPPFQPAVVKEEKGEERAAKLLVVRKPDLPRSHTRPELVQRRFWTEYDTQRCPSKFELITGHSSFKQGWLYLLSESSLSYVYAVVKQPASNC